MGHRPFDDSGYMMRLHDSFSYDFSSQIVPVSFQTDPCTPDKFFSEDEVKLNFEKAHKELETILLKAMHLLGQKAISEEPHSKYEVS